MLMLDTVFSGPYVTGVSTEDVIGYFLTLLSLEDIFQLLLTFDICGERHYVLGDGSDGHGRYYRMFTTPPPLFRGFSPESILHSIRSKLSLPSLRGKDPGSFNKSNHRRNLSAESVAALASQTPHTGQYDGQSGRTADIKTFVMGALPNEQVRGEIPSEGILVNNGISSSVEEV